MKPLRIFISSPGDVAEEREKARQVIAGLQLRYDQQVSLMPVLWEDLAIPATASFQEGIDLVLAERHRIDIAVFILWSRLGSPLGAAITKPDGSSYRSGTEREFDLMLAAFEQSGRKTPVILAYARDDNEGFNERLDARVQGEEALEEILSQRKLVKQFIRENFQDKGGQNVRAYHSYREPVAFAQRLHVHLRGAIDDLLEFESAGATWAEAPYRSLEVFDIKHAPIFCGRDEETCDLLQRLRDQQAGGCAFACIVGASGSGKSSLARAGVAATLMQRSFDDGIKEWRSAVFLPGLGAGDLFQSLACTLAEVLADLHAGPGGVERFAKSLRDGNHEAASILLDAAFKSAGDKIGGPVRLLLVLDQMEELWTERSITHEKREAFLQALESVGRSGHVSVVAPLRSDFYPQAQLSEAFLRMKGERGHFDLTPPGPAALQQLIVRPAQRAGLRFERNEATGGTLDQRILKDAAADPSALPLLQYALAELYEGRDEKLQRLTFAAYEAMGGVEGALGKRAAQTFERLPAEAQAALEEVLPLLVSVDIAGEQNAVRRRAPLPELMSTPARRLLVEALVKARFLTTDVAGDGSIATLAHEALLRRWDRITTWINTNRDLLRMRTRVEQYCAMWEGAGCETSLLLPEGLPLEEGRKLMLPGSAMLDEKTRKYVETSAEFHLKAQRLRQQRRRLAMTGLSTLTVLSLVVGVLAFMQWREANAKRMEAEVQREKTRVALGEARLQLDRAHLEEGRAWVERARTAEQKGDLLSALMLAGRSLGFAGYGRRASESEAFASEFPLLLAAPMDDPQLEAARQKEQTEAREFIKGLHLQPAWWSSPRIQHHDVAIFAITMDRQKRVLATGDQSGLIRLWEISTGRRKADLRAGRDGIEQVVFSEDGTRLMSLNSKGDVCTWEVESGKLIESFDQPRGSPSPFRKPYFLSADGRWLAKVKDVSQDETKGKMIEVWDVRRQTLAASLPGCPKDVNQPVMSPDGRLVACIEAHYEKKPRRITVWQVDKAAVIASMEAHAGGETVVAFSPDSRLLASTAGNEPVKIWDAHTGRLVREMVPGTGFYNMSILSFSPDGASIIKGGGNYFERCSTATGERLPGPAVPYITGMCISSDGRLHAFAGVDGRVRLWDAADNRVLEDLAEGQSEGITDMVFSADGSSLVTLSASDVVSWNLLSGTPRQGIRFGASHDTENTQLSADGGQRIYVNYAYGRKTAIQMVDSMSGKVAATIEREEKTPSWLRMSGDDRVLAFTNGRYEDPNQLEIWNLSTQTKVAGLSFPGMLVSLSLNHDGTQAAMVLREGKERKTSLQLWDLATQKPLFAQEDESHSYARAVFSPAGGLLAVPSSNLDGGVRLLALPSGQQQCLLLPSKSNGSSYRTSTLAFSPDGKLLATAAESLYDTNCAIDVWDVASRQVIRRLMGHRTAVNLLVFSRDGRWLASSSKDQTVMIWNMAASNDCTAALRSGILQLGSREASVPDTRSLFGNRGHALMLLENAAGVQPPSPYFTSARLPVPASVKEPGQREMMAVISAHEAAGTAFAALSETAQQSTLSALLTSELRRLVRTAARERASPSEEQVSGLLRQLDEIAGPGKAWPAALWVELCQTTEPMEKSAGKENVFFTRHVRTLPVDRLEAMGAQLAAWLKERSLPEAERVRAAGVLRRLTEAAPKSLPILRAGVELMEVLSEDWLRVMSLLLAHADAVQEDYTQSAKRLTERVRLSARTGMKGAKAADTPPLPPEDKRLLDKAWEVLDEGMRRFPEDAALIATVGWSHMDAADFERAGQIFAEARKAWKPQENTEMLETVLAGLATAAKSCGKADEAVAAYKELIETNPARRWAEGGSVSKMVSGDKLRSMLQEVRVLTLERHPQLGSAPGSFEFDYQAEPSPGLRSWKNVGGGRWEEHYSSGTVSKFTVSGRAAVREETGTVATKDDDPAMQVFIPDLNPVEGWFYFRTKDAASGKWLPWVNLAKVSKMK